MRAQHRAGKRRFWGRRIAGAHLVNLDMENPDEAEREWPAISRLLHISLAQGDNAYMQCMVGVHRAGAAAAITRMTLYKESLEEASHAVASLRHVEPFRCFRVLGNERATRTAELPLPVPSSPMQSGHYRSHTHAVTRHGTLRGSALDTSAVPICNMSKAAGEITYCPAHLSDFNKNERHRWEDSLCSRCRPLLRSWLRGLAIAQETMKAQDLWVESTSS